MKISDLNPHIRYLSRHYAHLRRSVHSVCYDCRLFYVENAAGYAVVDGKRHELTKDSILFFPPRTKYRFSFDKSDKFSIIVFDFDLVSDYSHLKDVLGTPTEHTFDERNVPLYEISEEFAAPIVRVLPSLHGSLSQCHDIFSQKMPYYRATASAILKLCLIELIRSNPDNGDNRLLCEDVLQYIRENYADSGLSNREIADRFNYHPYHLSNIIKEYTGKTLHQYLISYRLRMAKRLLLTTKEDLESISCQTGFCSASYFIKTFRKQTGVTPKKYRASRIHTEL